MVALVRRAAAVLLLCFLAYAAIPSGAADKPKEEIVAFNTKTYKYHCLQCRHAKACTKNCIEIAFSEAKERGIACKVCRGTCGAAVSHRAGRNSAR